MVVTKNENISPFDVDGTLVIQRDYADINQKEVCIRDPLDASRMIIMAIHEPMVRLLKEEAAKGFHIIVWSRGGWGWAEAVVKALDIEQYVNEVKTKPLVYFDDLPVEQWLPYRVFLSPDSKYKK